MPKTIDKCIFCGFDGKLTREHVLSKWLHKHVPRYMKTYPTLVATQFRDRSQFQIRKRTGDPRDWRIRCVCETNCNNGWMRKLDEITAPILTSMLFGEALRITPEQQGLISAWAMMKAIVAEYDDPPQPTTHHMQRRRLMNKCKHPVRAAWTKWLV